MSFDALNISASALYAQRVKMDTVASNMANVNTTRNPDGTPGVYKRKDVVFSSAYNSAINQNDSSNGVSGVEIGNNSLLKGGVSINSSNIAAGVDVNQIVEDQSPGRKVYNPSHPDADSDGYITMPNVNIVTEMIDMISASRAYEANITVMDTTKGMLSSALKI
jgi:flagellar basal-body rod protein FlgC